MTIIKKKSTITALYMIMIGLFLAVGCKKDNGKEDNNPKEKEELFCLYLNIENIEKTLPFINDFLSKQSDNLDDAQKLQDLATWLKLHHCIIDASVLCESCIYTDPPQSEILISFEENRTAKKLILDVLMNNPLRAVGYHDDDHEEEFCLLVNETDILQTSEMVDEFLNNLSNDLNDEQKMHELITWLNSKSCIFDATLKPSYSYKLNFFEITFSFNENEIIQDYVLVLKRTDNTFASWYYRQYEAGLVIVLTKGGTTNQTFDFINLFDPKAEKIYYAKYISDMPPNNMQDILNFLKTKLYTYTYYGEIGKCSAVVFLVENKIHVSVLLYNMQNKEFQTDWLKTMDELKFVDNNKGGFLIDFLVPKGHEKEWVLKFQDHEYVELAELSYYYYGEY